MSDTRPTALIIGAGPAGLTVAHELLTRTGIKPIVVERSGHMGGLARTEVYKGNRIDIGGHRFFSKADRVMDWWLARMPMQKTSVANHRLAYHGQSRGVLGMAEGPDPEREDRVMLLRPRKSRIYFGGKLYDYPISASADTVLKMGLWKTARVGASYVRSSLFPIKPEENLEQFFINRFGRELYRTFFEDYTEKVWGLPCSEISAEWGAQRVKGLSIRKALAHAMRKAVPRRGDFRQKSTETSLIEQFLYPKYGPGQMWELVAEEVKAMGGEIVTGSRVTGFRAEGNRVREVVVREEVTGRESSIAADYVFSTMPVRHLVRGMGEAVPAECRRVAEGLVYRDFFTVGLLVEKLRLRDETAPGGLIRDNWLYIQEPGVKIGRLQVFNNWSPYMVADPSKVWLGLEYFCNDRDEIWRRPDAELINLGTEELDRIGVIDRCDAIEGVVIRVPKTYPAYFGTYHEFEKLRRWLDGFENLALLGRNGMHRYNNQDHAMLTAMTAVDNIVAGRPLTRGVWEVNVEQEYHEEKR